MKKRGVKQKKESLPFSCIFICIIVIILLVLVGVFSFACSDSKDGICSFGSWMASVVSPTEVKAEVRAENFLFLALLALVAILTIVVVGIILMVRK